MSLEPKPPRERTEKPAPAALASGDITTFVAGERVVLLSERGLWWPRHQTLIIADSHFGKAATFRAKGIPIPRGTTASDLVRLGTMIERTGCQRLVVLGDFYHAASGRDGDVEGQLLAWRRRYAHTECLVVRGNHDLHAGDAGIELDIRSVDEPFAQGPFIWRHHPEPSDDGYVLAGHVHPAAQLSGPGGERLTLPCFHFGPAIGLLPAFGGFTGNGRVSRRPGDRVFVLVEDRVVSIPAGSR